MVEPYHLDDAERLNPIIANNGIVVLPKKLLRLDMSLPIATTTCGSILTDEI